MGGDAGSETTGSPQSKGSPPQMQFVGQTKQLSTRTGTVPVQITRWMQDDTYEYTMGNSGIRGTCKHDGMGGWQIVKTQHMANDVRRRMASRRVLERLLRYENHYSSGAEGYPPK